MIQRSYDKSKYGKLYLVPTPIGNMEDISFRAIETLKNVDKVYAEDTRVTGLLLKKYDIKKKISSCHKYSEEQNKNKIINELINGLNIAYASDRGTPLISDPGEVVVQYAIENNIDVISLPGASALLPALNMSGIENDRFMFYGFLDSKEKARKDELKELCSFKYSMIFYESPHRLQSTLRNIKEIMGDRSISVCREISKVHEEVFRGRVNEAIKTYEEVKGEIVIVVEGKILKDNINAVEKVKELIDKGYKMSQAVKEVATINGISKNELYNECMEKLL